MGIRLCAYLRTGVRFNIGFTCLSAYVRIGACQLDSSPYGPLPRVNGQTQALLPRFRGLPASEAHADPGDQVWAAFSKAAYSALIESATVRSVARGAVAVHHSLA